MDNRFVGFFDSGIGGLPYLERTRDLLPGERYAYFADGANFPYGEKPADQVLRIVLEAMDRFIGRTDPKSVVVACNTASVIALDALRKRFGIPFIGVVPAVKPAAQVSRQKTIGLLATSRTVADAYTEDLIRAFASGCTVHRYPESGMVTAAELLGRSVDGERTVKDLVARMKEDGIDTLVLGCTHFIFFEKPLRTLLGEGVAVVDSRDGVARQVKKVLESGEITALSDPDDGRGSVFFTSGGDETRFSRMAADFGLEYGGLI